MKDDVYFYTGNLMHCMVKHAEKNRDVKRKGKFEIQINFIEKKIYDTIKARMIWRWKVCEERKKERCKIKCK